MQIVRALNKFYNTEGTLEDFILSSFSDDLATFKMPPNNEFSCCKFSDSPLDFLMKFKATHKINPKTFDKGLNGIIMPQSDSQGNKLNYNLSSPGESKYFKSVVEDHCDYIARDEAEVRDVAGVIFKQEKFEHFSHKEFDDYLLREFKTPEWRNYLLTKDGKRWKNYVVSILKDKVRHDYSFEFKKNSLEEAYNEHGDVFKDKLIEISSLKKFEGEEKSEIMKAFKNNQDFKELF